MKKPPDRSTLGGRVRALREERELTQPELARMAGISQPTLWAIETGTTTTENVKASVVIRLCRVLVTTWEYLWSGRLSDADAGVAQATERALMATYRSLDDAGRVALLTTANALAQRQQAAVTARDEIERAHKVAQEHRVPKPKPKPESKRKR